MTSRSASTRRYAPPRLAVPGDSPHRRQVRLLGWTSLFIALFSIATLIIILVFDPDPDVARSQYVALIGGLVLFATCAYFLNRADHYRASAMFLVIGAAIVPWVWLFFEPSIDQSDIIPLMYVTFSVLLSGMFLSIRLTFVLAVLQFAGIILVAFFGPFAPALSWFSFVAFVLLVSIFSLLANHTIQRDMRQIDKQVQQLALNEALLKEQLVHDELTGLYNRRYLEDMFEREIQRSLRKQSPLSVVILDVDGFKQINDTLGHAAGDAALRELGSALGKKFRQSDIACRYGGDEFVLVLPEASPEKARERVEQLQHSFESSSLRGAISLSAGIASAPENGTDSRALLACADRALYNAKRAGPNRVVMAS